MVLSEPRYGKTGVMTILESRLLNVMKPGSYYSSRNFSRLTNMDLSTIEEGMKRLNKKGLIDAYWYFDVDGVRAQKYKVFTLKNSSEGILKTASETFLKQGRPSSSSSSSSESDSETEEEERNIKNGIRKLSEGAYA
jgi:U3 small nucleolar RNA-associated protein 14